MKYFITLLLFFIVSSSLFSQTKIVTWNVHMVINAKNKKQRAIAINKILIDSKADVVLIQEAFGKPVCNILSKGFKYRILPNKKFGKVNSGLLVLSNSPLTNIQYLNYKHKKGIDALSNKGAVKFRTAGMNMINTHLQNHHHNITENQIIELYNFSSSSDVIAGDFNYTDISYLSILFQKNIIETDCTFDNEVIDYVITNKKIRSQVMKTDLSDHNAIISIID